MIILRHLFASLLNTNSLNAFKTAFAIFFVLTSLNIRNSRIATVLFVASVAYSKVVT